jgi:hypothetical protein
MTSPTLIALYLTVWAVLMKALAHAAKPPRATCARCARPLERQALGEPVCRCRH